MMGVLRFMMLLRAAAQRFPIVSRVSSARNLMSITLIHLSYCILTGTPVRQGAKQHVLFRESTNDESLSILFPAGSLVPYFLLNVFFTKKI
jgi:hypothetical protein